MACALIAADFKGEKRRTPPRATSSCRTIPKKRQAKDELNETDEKRASAVKELRGMIKEKADAGDELAKGVQDTFGEKPDSLLVRFIRARKYDVPRSFELLKGRVLPKCGGWLI